MTAELRVPEIGESIREVQIGNWLSNAGAHVDRDNPVVELESDKATVELPAPVSGTITKILKKTGETATVGEVIGYMEESAAPAESKGKKKTKEADKPAAAAPAPAPAPVAASPAAARKELPPRVMPAAQRELAARGLKVEDVPATGPGGRVLKEDVLRRVVEPGRPEPAAAPAVPAAASPTLGLEAIMDEEVRLDEAIPMTPMRKRIAQRLVQAQQTAALLTTFNEIDMSAVMALREEHKDAFQKRYGVKLGFMSFFVKAAIDGLKQFPQINAEIRGEDIVYHNYCDIGISIGGGKGLVVPIIRNAERMGFADIERAIGDFGARAKENKLKLEELQGGTFTITNGGIFGSLMSTPIVNPPQSAILGMHAIQDRPVAHDGQVVIRPMMYVALTYDHRIVDGREAVTFLKRIKECVEAPSRILLEI
ncbi:MAG: 2-oxoglutarate dehydrogenase complex dihydrolipoyllysine-residue succinyltransferase [Candidatus Hydrogenedentes bacterium]|nr:2-oxoglutarate dehydrogenase complex dihydrolipoyllysine-residue succinyltransferase [Candidatus Hydrogenedentota bacterium]